MINRKKVLFFIIILLISNFFVFAKKLANFPELTKYLKITIGKDKIYISDGKEYKIRIYSRKNYKYIKSFGNKGEGPGEFVNYPSRVFIRKEKLILLNNREYHFTLNGKLIKERKLKIRHPILVLDGFVGMEFEIKRKLTRFGHPYILINTYNNEFKKIKTIYKIIGKSFIMKRIKEFECFSFQQGFDVTEDKIVVYDPQKGFYFKIFDSKGTELYEINVPYEKKKVTKEIKNNEIRALAKTFGKRWKSFKRTLVFPDYIPAYWQAKVFDNKIYAFTFNRKGDFIELITIDLKGKVLGKTFVPRDSQYMCTVKDGIYYYLHEGYDSWELHSLKAF